MKSFDKSILKTLLTNPNPIILDIGSYDGKDSLEFLNIFKNATIFAFEADKRSINLFKENVKNKPITLVPLAISDIKGKVKWYSSDSKTRRHYKTQNSWSASSSIKPPQEHLHIWEDVYFNSNSTVESTTLDIWVKDKNINMIDFIWCDVNGANKEFIKGGNNTLSNKVKYMMLEFEEVELYDGSMSLSMILDSLPNFEKIDIFNFHGNYGNVLLKNKKINNGKNIL